MPELDELAALEVRRVRRRQLINAVVHGSARSWTTGTRRWPMVLAGGALAVLVILGVGVTQVVRAQLAETRQSQTQPTSR